MTGYIPKPIDLQKIEDTLKTNLEVEERHKM